MDDGKKEYVADTAHLTRNACRSSFHVNDGI